MALFEVEFVYIPVLGGSDHTLALRGPPSSCIPVEIVTCVSYLLWFITMFIWTALLLWWNPSYLPKFIHFQFAIWYTGFRVKVIIRFIETTQNKQKQRASNDAVPSLLCHILMQSVSCCSILLLIYKHSKSAGAQLLHAESHMGPLIRGKSELKWQAHKDSFTFHNGCS